MEEGGRGSFFDLDSQRQSLTTLLSISWKSCKGNSLGKGGSISDFTLCLVGGEFRGWKTLGGKLGGKKCFPLFGNRRKMGRKENPENIFSPGPTKFILPNREENAGEKVLSQHFYKNIHS